MQLTSDGLDALWNRVRRRYAAPILNLSLPDMSGFEILHWTRQFDRERVTTMIAGDLALNPRKHVVTVDRRPIAPHPPEFALLRLLMRMGEVSLSKAARHLDILGEDVDEDVVLAYLRLLQEKLDMRVEQSDRGWRLLSTRTLH
ncbi:MAG: hypothetical protein ABI520_05505 [Caldimonas sp.]